MIKDTVLGDEKSLSYSQYSIWATCPKRWELEHVKKLAEDGSTIHTVFGDAIHQVIQEWLVETKEEYDEYAASIDLAPRLKEKLKECFKEATVINESGNATYVSDLDTLMSFYQEGLLILEHLQKHRSEHFDVQTWDLIGVETRLEYPLRKGLKYKGFLDLVFQNRLNKVIKIVDLKTSTKGWSFWQKKDQLKKDQLLLYKKFYSKVHKVPVERIYVEFIILTRQLDGKTERVEKYDPMQKADDVQAAYEGYMRFADEAYDESGDYILGQKATPGKNNCRFCPFNDNKALCKESYYPETAPLTKKKK